MKITNTSQSVPYINMLIYGKSGVGKTVFCSTAEDVLFLNVEGGEMSIRDKSIDMVKVDKFQDVKDTFKYLRNNPEEYKAVAIDSITELQKKSMDAFVKEDGNDMPSMKNWGQNIEQMRRVIRVFRDLPIHCIFTALERSQDTEEGFQEKLPALQGKTLPQEVMGFVDIVGYMFTKEKKNDDGSTRIVRPIRVQPGKNISAKDRLSNDKADLGTYVKPDFGEFLEVLNKQGAPKKKKSKKSSGKKKKSKKKKSGKKGKGKKKKKESKSK